MIRSLIYFHQHVVVEKDGMMRTVTGVVGDSSYRKYAATEKGNQELLRYLSKGWRIVTVYPNSKPKPKKGKGKRKGKKGCSTGTETLSAIVKRCAQDKSQQVIVEVSDTKKVSEHYANAIAKPLLQLLGRGLKVTAKRNIDAIGLAMAYETGDNPLPYLEARDERKTVRVFVTPDWSGSCQDFSEHTNAIAVALEKVPNISMVYIQNSNAGYGYEVFQMLAYRKAGITGKRVELGNYVEFRESIEKVLDTCDVFLYFGDTDGYERCLGLAASGKRVIGLSCYACKSGLKPARLLADNCAWIDGVNSKDALSVIRAIENCVEIL